MGVEEHSMGLSSLKIRIKATTQGRRRLGSPAIDMPLPRKRKSTSRPIDDPAIAAAIPIGLPPKARVDGMPVAASGAHSGIHRDRR